MSLRNPLQADGLTAETVSTGDRIEVQVPGMPSSIRRYEVLNEPYNDDEGDRVVDLRDERGREVTLLTSEAGLSGGRYDGAWTHVAAREQERSR